MNAIPNGFERPRLQAPARKSPRLFGLASLALATWLLPNIANSTDQRGIHGRDDRELFEAASQPEFNAVGRLNRENGGFCSAVLIAGDEILTAAHCVWDRQRQAYILPEMLHFVPGYRRGNYLGHARGIDIKTASALAFDQDGQPNDYGEDWAVIKLDLDLTAGAGVQPIPLAGRQTILALDEQSLLIRVGYSSDRPHLPVKVAPCSVHAIVENRRLLVHDCDATAGDSGSPIMVVQNEHLFVIGIHSAIVAVDEEWFGVAPMLARQFPSGFLLNRRVGPVELVD